MIHLPKFNRDYSEVLDSCIAGITGNAQLHARLTQSKDELNTSGTEYSDKSECGQLYLLESLDDNTDPVVIGNLTRSDLIKIYTQYFVPFNKPARRIYDELMVNAKEKCPFCGGIGTPWTLDHFLPKKPFPRYSVLPENLIPSCRDCNMGDKASQFVNVEELQIIHPYSDNQCFFSEQWVFAAYHSHQNEPGYYEYTVSPPDHWSDVYKARANAHFSAFNLAKRFATKAAEHAPVLENQILQLRVRGLNNSDIWETLLQPGIISAPFVNHWMSGMFLGRANAL